MDMAQSTENRSQKAFDVLLNIATAYSVSSCYIQWVEVGTGIHKALRYFFSKLVENWIGSVLIMLKF